jgi:ketosteroid isomerase-like protein
MSQLTPPVPDPPPHRTVEHDRLEALVGRWTVHGHNSKSHRQSAGAAIAGEMDCHWLPGRFFLELRDEARIGGEQIHISKMIFGLKPDSGYFAQFFDNLGYTRRYSVDIQESTWTLSGKCERATYTFGQDGGGLSIQWEQRGQDGELWEPLCDLRASKIAPPDDVVHDCFAAYAHRDRGALEKLLAEDFSFTSPYDDHIDKRTYFERCWPNSGKIRAHHVQKLIADGDEAFVCYELETVAGERWRNTEFFRTKNGKIAEVQVYFGQK